MYICGQNEQINQITDELLEQKSSQQSLSNTILGKVSLENDTCVPLGNWRKGFVSLDKIKSYIET